MLASILSMLTLWIVKFFEVEQGYVTIVTAFGKVKTLSLPGLNSCFSLWGLYKKPSKTISVKEQISENPFQEVYTKDGVKCEVHVIVYFTITDAEKAVFSVENYEAAVNNLCESIIRNGCGEKTARELLASRTDMASSFRSQLDSGTTAWGIKVRLVEIKNLKIEQGGGVK